MPGKILVYTGDGEGKTTASLGHAIRFAGYGKKVAVLHFMKGRKTGEFRFLESHPQIDVFLYGPPYFLATTQSVLSGWMEGEGLKFVSSAGLIEKANGKKNGKKVAADKVASRLRSCSFEAHKKKAKKGIECANKLLEVRKHKLIVLDEILYAIKFKLIREVDVLNLLEKRKDIHMILTGRSAPESIVGLADLVTYLEEGKHYFQKEKKALIGLDF
ncbi:MAG: cob(I)yrinic acid a,c-diamide adenosyltransferase [Candidatus Aenigmatarchaeota archaeon]